MMKSNLLIEFLDSVYEKISAYSTSDRKILVYKGEAYDLNNKDLKWQEAELPYKWDTSDSIYFKKEIIVPEKVFDIGISGSRMDIFGSGYRKLLDSFVRTVVLLHGELYIDGEKQFEEKNWCELRYRRTISEKVLPGDSHSILLHFFKRDINKDEYPRLLNIFEIFYSNVDEMLFEIRSLSSELSYIKNILGKGNDLEKVLENIKMEKFDKISTEELIATINTIKNCLRELKIDFKKFKIHLIGHAHIDINWQWGFKETIKATHDTFRNIEGFMKKYDSFSFSHSQAFLYSEIEKSYPQIFGDVKRRIKEERWDPVASSWVEMDLNLLNGESIVRQILYAKRYIREKFNFEPVVFWAPDAFGHPWSLPQILEKSNIKYYYFMRGLNEENDLFWWEGIDGSRVLAFNSIYFGDINIKRLLDLVENTKSKHNINESMYVYGVCNHGGGPTLKDIELVEKLNSDKLFPELKFSTTDDYFSTIFKKGSKIKKRICREFNPIFDGTYTSHNDIKYHNRQCERLLIQNETLGSVIELLEGEYPDLEKYWKDTMVNQFHDTIAGCAVKVGYDYAVKKAEAVEARLNNLLNKNMKYLFENFSYKKEGIPIIVFNSLSWERNDIIRVKMNDVMPEYPSVIDDSGNICQCQVEGDELVFIASAVPAVGYKVFYIIDSGRTNTGERSILSGGLKLENDFFILNLNSENGIIEYLYDKQNKRFVMKYQRDEGDIPEESFFIKNEGSAANCQITEPMMNNLLQIFYEDPHSMSSWVIGPASEIVNLINKADIKVVSNGPVFADIRILRKFNKSKIIQNIRLYKNIDRVDFVNILLWKEKSGPEIKAPMLRASFTPILDKTKAVFEIPFGSIERVADGQQYPALKWVDISDDYYGVSILTDTKYGFSIKGNTISITLTRTSNEPDPNPEGGKYFFSYSIYPHKGNIKKSDTVRKGYELNYPLLSYTDSRKGRNNHFKEKSYINMNKTGVVLSCFKKSEDGNSFVIRLYESKGKSEEVKVETGFKFKNIVETDLLENPINNKLVTGENFIILNMKPFEIKTFKILI